MNGWKVFGIVILFFILCLPVSLAMRGCNWLNRAQQVVSQEVDPAVLLKKYMWFKEQSSALDEKLATLQVYTKRFERLKTDYAGKQRSEWARDDREQYSIWESEASGISAMYNQLAAEYNAKMVEINWAFTNVGQLPKGATTPLPREYKPYQTE